MFAKLRQIPLVIGMLWVCGSVSPQARASETAPVSSVIRVTTTADEFKPDRRCSLREAVYAAVNNVKIDSCGRGSADDEIMVPSGHYILSRSGISEDRGLTGDLDLSGSIAFLGASSANTIIDGANLDRVFEVFDGDITFNDVTIQNGQAPYIGGAVYVHDAVVTINRSILQYNQARMGNPATTDDDKPTFGGAIAVDNGSLHIIDSTLRENDTESLFRWHLGLGGAIYTKANTQTTIDSSIIDSNSGQWYKVSDIVNYGSLEITNTTLKNMQEYGVKNTNTGTLTINASVFLNNMTPALENNGSASVILSEFSGSMIKPASPEYCENGGAIWNAGSLVVDMSHLHHNQARNGGGIWNSGTLAVHNTSIVSNTVVTGGHFCAGQGAGIYMSQGALELENSTLAFNAANGSGGGIWFGGSAQGTLVNNTIASNSNALQSVFGQPVPDGAGIVTNADTVKLTNTILASNHSPSAASDCWGPLTSNGHNLIQTPTTPCTISGTLDGNQVGVNPLLGSLGNYGGPSPTLPLLVGSPAIDAGSPTVCPATDQRGVTRPLDGDDQGPVRCDIGSFEVE